MCLPTSKAYCFRAVVGAQIQAFQRFVRLGLSRRAGYDGRFFTFQQETRILSPKFIKSPCGFLAGSMPNSRSVLIGICTPHMLFKIYVRNDIRAFYAIRVNPVNRKKVDSCEDDQWNGTLERACESSYESAMS